MDTKLSIEEIDALDEEEFMNHFCHVIEDGSDYVERVYNERPFGTADRFLKAFHLVLENTDLKEKEQILKKYPQLGTKTEMTKYSVEEHESAGLDRLQRTEDEELELLNRRYTDKFGFPFVVCVKDKNPEKVIGLIKKRIDNDKMTEIQIGIDEVKKIAQVRLLPKIKI